MEAEATERNAPDRDIKRLLDDLDERMNAGDYDDALADGPIGDWSPVSAPTSASSPIGASGMTTTGPPSI